MKQLIYITLSLFLSFHSVAQNKLAEDDQKFLKLLLKERKDKFEQYTSNLDNKTGFFGNQSKKDVKLINETLKEIVRTDNKIILELDRLLDQNKFKSKASEFETQKASEDLVTLELQKQKYLSAIDTLQKQVEFYKVQTKESGSNKSYKWAMLFFLLTTLVLLFTFYKNRKTQTNDQ